jgi:GAF domain-containing protein
MIAAPLIVKGVCIGAIQIINKKSNAQLFDKEDLELLGLFATSSAMYIKNASLFNAEKKAKDLGILIQIGKEITSTLDLDSVLMTLVNLSSQVIPFDLASVSTIKTNGKAALRAISGEKEIDSEIPLHLAIQNLHDYVLRGKKDLIYFSAREQAEKDEAQKEIFQYMQANDIGSLWIKILSDDQGNVGVIHLESKNDNLMTAQRNELLSILISQTTVALRNVELYNTIPSSHFVKNLKQAFINKALSFREWPKEQYYKLSGIALVALLSLIFIKVPHNISSNVQIQPLNHTFFSKLTGQVKSVFVKEGQYVKAGDLLVELDVGDTLIELQNKEARRAKARVEMLKLQSENQIADYKIKESELLSLDYEMELLTNKVKNSKIYSNVEGIVISEKLDDLVGMPVNYGQELVKIARHDKLIAQFEVPEADILFVRSNQNVQFKVYGHPTTSFGDEKLVSVSGEARQVLETDPNKYYMAKAIVDVSRANHAVLRPGMTGRGKIYSDWRPLGEKLFSRVYNFIIMEFIF